MFTLLCILATIIYFKHEIIKEYFKNFNISIDKYFRKKLDLDLLTSSDEEIDSEHIYSSSSDSENDPDYVPSEHSESSDEYSDDEDYSSNDESNNESEDDEKYKLNIYSVAHGANPTVEKPSRTNSECSSVFSFPSSPVVEYDHEQNKNNIKIGDIISFDLKDIIVSPGTFKRSPSNYGDIQITPDYTDRWIVKNIEYTSMSDNNKNNHIKLYVFPENIKEPYTINDYGSVSTVRGELFSVFWYINLTTMTINNFEDDSYKYMVENMKKV